jgi:uncharacterized membrane protein
MLYTLAVILLVLWMLGLVTGYTIGAFIHVLLVIAIVLLLVQLISGRRIASRRFRRRQTTGSHMRAMTGRRFAFCSSALRCSAFQRRAARTSASWC